MSSLQVLIHLCQRTAWENSQAAGEYRAASLETEGFIHCSRPEQILSVANTFYREQADLVLLWIDPGKVQPEIRWEAADNQVFPHVYGPLNLDAVVAASAINQDEAGVFRKLERPDIIEQYMGE
jgi:uncharacterized protein (DUF952 family)